MTSDPYTEAIAAGAAALAKPYRDPDTIGAFVEAFPTLAAARVINAALPVLRETITAETIPAGPCPATERLPVLDPDRPKTLYALCDLRAGHAGQHEAEDTEHGHFRWSGAEETRRGCKSHIVENELRYLCVRISGHRGYHVAEHIVWNDLETVVAR